MLSPIRGADGAAVCCGSDNRDIRAGLRAQQVFAGARDQLARCAARSRARRTHLQNGFSFLKLEIWPFPVLLLRIMLSYLFLTK